jgi:hypothetical protein
MKTLGLAVLSCLVAVSVAHPARAEASHEYEVAANDGYGLEDCLAEGSQCGQVVADAWCEAHGHGHALAYGLRNVVEGRPTQVSATDESYVIKCGD